MNKRKQTTSWVLPKKVFLVFFAVLLILFARYCYLALSKTINGRDIKKFAESRNTVSKVLTAKRGTIYDLEGSVLAQNVTSYTIILYLDDSRDTSTEINHVVDVEETSKQLAKILKTKASIIEEKINKGIKGNKYQIELGSIGKNITEITKSEIEDLNLAGIDFDESYKRYYPNGKFASYVIGYAKTNEIEEKDGTITTSIDGELGVEGKYDKQLKGKDGFLSYQRDRFGYKIPDTKESRTEAENGDDIYLTIDASIQRFAETAITEIKKYKPEWAVVAVMDAKTGDILASASDPSFDPNTRDIKNYENPLVTYTYEPGSTMKTYTYMCAIEKGTYNGKDKFKSGSIEVEDATIRDWNNRGWGSITYDKGFEYSSNVGISYMMQKFIGKQDLNDCLSSYGFGTKTGIELSNEASGSLKFRYPVEVANAGFGQGITTTVVQQLQGLSIIANNGKKLSPHIISKIVDPNTKKTTYKREITSTEQLVSDETIDKMKDLMYNVVNSKDGNASGKNYKINGYNIIGKTGTAQISLNGKYLKNNYIYSFAGMYPKDDPEIIVYAAVKRPNVATSKVLSSSVKPLLKNIAKYKGMFTGEKASSTVSKIKLKSYTNKNVKTIQNNLSKLNIKTKIIGNGNKIINQFPKANDEVISYDEVILITNDNTNKMPNLIGYSRSEVIFVLDALNINYKIDGYGYVKTQSLKAGENTKNKKVTLTLK